MALQLLAGARRAPRFHALWHAGHTGFWVLIVVIVALVVLATVLARRHR